MINYYYYNHLGNSREKKKKKKSKGFVWKLNAQFPLWSVWEERDRGVCNARGSSSGKIRAGWEEGAVEMPSPGRFNGAAPGR